jgi:hypothetical protein
MVCHARSATESSRRRRLLPSSPPSSPLAILDLSNRTEYEAHKYLTFATTRRGASLRLLDLRRAGPVLLCAVVWVHRKVPSLLEIDLADSTGLALHFTDCDTIAATRAEMQRRSAKRRQGPHQ